MKVSHKHPRAGYVVKVQRVRRMRQRETQANGKREGVGLIADLFRAAIASAGAATLRGYGL
jgi:hypothetical protein